MTPVQQDVAARIGQARRMLRRDGALAVALAGLCAVPAALLVAAALHVVMPWSRPGWGPLLFDVVVAALVGVLVHRAVKRWVFAVDDDAVAADAERSSGAPEGSVRGVLELARAVPDGTSAALAARASREVGARLPHEGLLATGLARRISRRRRAAATTFAALGAAALMVGFLAPDASRAAWSPLVSPVDNLSRVPLPPLDVLPGDAEVPRGEDALIRVRAEGRDIVVLHWRAAGDVPRDTMLTVEGDSASGTIPGVASNTTYRIEAPDGARSVQYTLTPTDPLLLSDLAIEVIHPRHVQRDNELYRGDVPPLELPAGSRLVISGRATRELGTVHLTGAGASAGVELNVDGEQFEGTFSPASSGMYVWQAEDRQGRSLGVAPPPLDIRIITDGAPQVEITFPANDTVLDGSLRQAVVADARDDYGVVAAELVSWRAGHGGSRGPERVTPVDVAGGDRLLIRTILDATSHDLLAGDSIRFFVRVTDSSPARQTGVSRTVRLYIPGANARREEAQRRAHETAERTSGLAQSAQRLGSGTRDLEQRTRAANARREAERQRTGQRTGAESRMSFEETAPARQLLEQQRELMERVDALRDEIRAMDRAMEQSGLKDGELERRMQELQKLQEAAMSPEMERAMEQLRRALEEMDPEALAQALEQLAQQQEAMKEQLDRMVEQMERAATEQEMNALAQQARELATQQNALSDALEQGSATAEQARQQEQLAEAAAELAGAVQTMQERLEQQGEQQAAGRTATAQQQAQDAGEAMQQAAQQARDSRSDDAAKSGERAAEQMTQAADQIDLARQDLADAARQRAREAFEQAMQDALSLANQQQDLLDRMKQAEQQGSQQQGGQQGQQQGGQQGQQQGGQQGQQQGGQQQGQQQGGQQQGGQGGQQSGQQQGGQAGAQGGAGGMQGMRQEQAALQQGLQQLGRNLQQGREQGSSVNRETSSAMARANLSMQQTLQAMRQGQAASSQMQETVDALNRLALSLLNNAQQAQQSESGTASERAQQQMADLAKSQASMNGQTGAMTPMDLASQAMSAELSRLGAQQMELARRLGNMNQGGTDLPSGELDLLMQEAEALARELQAGRVPPEVLARQERLFHRLLDAGRSMEKEEYDDERRADRAGEFDRANVEALDPRLFSNTSRFSTPSAETLNGLPPAYRRMVLDYFERLNRPAPPPQTGTSR